MICPICKEQGLRSKCWSNGEKSFYGIDSNSNVARPAMYWDEDGKWHVHDKNIYYKVYTCENNHEWSETEQAKCWCGENNTE